MTWLCLQEWASALPTSLASGLEVLMDRKVPRLPKERVNSTFTGSNHNAFVNYKINAPTRLIHDDKIISLAPIGKQRTEILAWSSMATSKKVQEALARNGMVYVSVTGLAPKGILAVPRFWWHAVPSKMQADSALGALFVEVKTVDSYHHTLTIWEDKKAMLAYMTSGAHKNAMKAFRSIGKGVVYGFETQSVPSWEEALALLWEKGRVLG